MTETAETLRTDAPRQETLREAARVAGAHSFATALCGFVGSTVAATVVLVLLGSI